MMSKLPLWAWIGATALTFIAGIINAVGFLGFQHQGVSHLTGTTTLFGIALAGNDSAQTVHWFLVMLSFLAGACVSGFIIQDSVLRLGRRYGVALAIESALLLLAVPLLREQNLLGDYLASSACGLQNAMASAYSGAVLRTTHVSGIFTDLGIFLGHLLRGMPVDWRRFRLWMALLLAFALGGTAGALLFSRFVYATLLFPAGLTGAAGVFYAVYWHRKREAAAR